MSDPQNTTATEGEATAVPSDVKEYRCIVLTGFGGVKNVKVEKKPEPQLKEGEMLIDVKIW